MQSAISSPKPVSRSEAGVLWYVWPSTAAGARCIIGVDWDVSWHESIGRDNFRTPAQSSLALTRPANLHAGHPDHASHVMAAEDALPAAVSSPYGFPKPGAYGIVVQVNRRGPIETDTFDANVEN